MFLEALEICTQKMKLYSDKINKAFSEILPAPQAVAQLQRNIK